MALNKLKFNSINVTPSASKAIRFNSDADGFETASAGGNVALIKTQTISSGTGTVSFVDGASSVVLDNTYKEYIFTFNNIHPSVNNAHFLFQGSVDTGSNYGVNITSSAFSTEHNEADSSTDLSYQTSVDLAQSTSFQRITSSGSHSNDDCSVGILRLFEPSSTTFVKHFIITGNTVADAYTVGTHIAGYFNSTSAIDAIQFKMASGNMDAGTITMYGVT
jgi:hypothetical protein|tara:strand:+ start:617 stop:1276 length:660 start_codon:yes stop_codon:yes gene_type:complete